MTLDRYTARALVDANLMSLREYIEKFGTATETETGRSDGLHVVRTGPANAGSSNRKGAQHHGLPRKVPTVARIICH